MMASVFSHPQFSWSDLIHTAAALPNLQCRLELLMPVGLLLRSLFLTGITCCLHVIRGCRPIQAKHCFYSRQYVTEAQ
jgi:hypothetical protein